MKSHDQETKPKPPQFKEQAPERARQDGVPKAAKDLGPAPAMLYGWQAESRQTGQPFGEHRLRQAEMARLKREDARLAEEVAFLKKSGGVLRQGAPAKYATIQPLQGEFAAGLMCRRLRVSRGGYHPRRQRPRRAASSLGRPWRPRCGGPSTTKRAWPDRPAAQGRRPQGQPQHRRPPTRLCSPGASGCAA